MANRKPLVQISGELAELPLTDVLLGLRDFSYVELTTSTNFNATTEATANTIVTAAAVTFDGVTPIYVEFFAPALEHPAGVGDLARIWLYDNGSSIGLLAQIGVTADAGRIPILVSRRLTPSAAAHTYSIRASVQTAAGQVVCQAGGAGLLVPAYIRVRKA